MYVGIDDTDSREGMCTTYAGLHAILSAINEGYDVIGYPRLVRLNPNVPWKTRGNGSVVIRVGEGSGRKIMIGEYRGEEIYAYEKLMGEPRDDFFEELVSKIEPMFVLDEESTNPGVVASRVKFREKLYWKAVRELLSVEYVEELLRSEGARYVKYKNGRGIIGASAGIAWRARKRTYELLAYTDSADRFVDESSVIEMDKRVEETFDNYDYMNKYVAIMPSSRTPVLYGIRAVAPEPLFRARALVRASPHHAYLVYETNQGTDDHLVRRRVSDIEPYQSVIVRGRVSARPARIEGGHVIFRIADGTGEIACAAYEPTKGFRDVVSALIPGDEVEVYGGVRAEPLTINVEKIRIISAPPQRVKISNPVCPHCNRKMESVGAGKGYRCRRCGYRLGEEAAEYRVVERNIEGFYEVPVIARRHLARPLKLIREDNMGNVF